MDDLPQQLLASGDLGEGGQEAPESGHPTPFEVAPEGFVALGVAEIDLGQAEEGGDGHAGEHDLYDGMVPLEVAKFVVPVENDVAELQSLGEVLPDLVGGDGSDYPLLVQPQDHLLGFYLLREEGVRVYLQLLKTVRV